MTTPPDLFDLDLLALRRARAEAIEAQERRSVAELVAAWPGAGQ